MTADPAYQYGYLRHAAQQAAEALTENNTDRAAELLDMALTHTERGNRV